jgi:hypothetical protein
MEHNDPKKIITLLDARRSRSGGSGGSGGGVDSGGNGPHDPGMEALIKRVDEIEARVGKVDDRLRGVEVGIARLEGKLDGLIAQVGSFERITSSVANKIPSWWQMPAVIGSTVALLMLFYAGAKHFGIIP